MTGVMEIYRQIWTDRLEKNREPNAAAIAGTVSETECDGRKLYNMLKTKNEMSKNYSKFVQISN